MTKVEWLGTVASKAPLLRSFIENYHPGINRENPPAPLPITAPVAELMSGVIRQRIAAKTDIHPVTRFDRALEQGRWCTLYSLLEQTWLGVPESIYCWSIPGFRLTVDLLEDLPEAEEG